MQTEETAGQPPALDPPWCFHVPDQKTTEAAWLAVVAAARQAGSPPGTIAEVNVFFTDLSSAASLFASGCRSFWDEMAEDPCFLNRAYAAKTIAWAEAYRDRLRDAERLALRFGPVPAPLAAYIAEARPNVSRGIEALRGIHLADDDGQPRC